MHDARLSPETLLQLAPTIGARFDAADHVLSIRRTILDVGPRGFAAFALFARPLAFGYAIATLESR